MIKGGNGGKTKGGLNHQAKPLVAVPTGQGVELLRQGEFEELPPWMIRIDIQIEAQGKGLSLPKPPWHTDTGTSGFLGNSDEPGIDQNGDEKRDPADGQYNSKRCGSKSAHIDQIAAFDVSDGRTEFPKEDK